MKSMTIAGPAPRRMAVTRARLLAAALSVLVAAVVLAQPQAALTEAQRIEAGLKELASYYQKIGDTSMASKLEEARKNGWLVVDQGSETYFWPPTGKIYMPNWALLAVVKVSGAIDFRALVPLAGTLTHEMVHATEEGWLGRAVTSRADRELSAYARPLQQNYQAARRLADALSANRSPKACDKEAAAKEIRAIAAEFARSYSADVAPKDTALDAPQQKRLTDLRALANHERADYNAARARDAYWVNLDNEEVAVIGEMYGDRPSALGGSPRALPPSAQLQAKLQEIRRRKEARVNAVGELAIARERVRAAEAVLADSERKYVEYTKQDVLLDVAAMRLLKGSEAERAKVNELRAEKAALEREIAALLKDSSHSNSQMARLSDAQARVAEIDRHIARYGGDISVPDALKEIEAIDRKMQELIEACNKERNLPPPPPPPDHERLRLDYLSCLCRACGGTGGGYFQSGSGDCSGRCACFGMLSGWCTYVPTDPKIAEQCAGSAEGKPVDDKKSKEWLQRAHDANRRAMEDIVNKLLKERRIDEAAANAEEALKADPSVASPTVGDLSSRVKDAGWRDTSERSFPSAIRRLESASRLNPGDADARRKLDDTKRFAQAWPRVEEKAREFDKLIGEKRVWSAYQSMLQMQDLQSAMPGGMNNPLSRRVTADLDRAIKEYNVFWQEKTALHTKYFNEQDWEAMQANAEQTLRRELNEASDREARSRLQFAQSRLAEQKAALDFAAQIKKAFEAGQLGDLTATVGELRVRAGVFKAQDPRGQPVRDLIAALEKRQRVLAAKAYANNFFSDGNRALAGYRYTEAVTQFAEGLRAMRENGDPSDPDYDKYERLRQDAEAKAQRVAQLTQHVGPVAMEPTLPARAVLEQALAEAEELVRLQPTDTNSQIYRNRIADKLRQQAANQQARERAAALWNEGKAIFDAGRPTEALVKFKESLRIWPDPSNQQYVTQLEARLGQMRAQAANLWNEGRALQQAGRAAEALGRYNESLRVWPDEANARYVQQLEAALAAQAATTAAPPQAAAPPLSTSAPPQVQPQPQAPPQVPPPLVAPPATAVVGTAAGAASTARGGYLVDLTPFGGKKGSPRTVQGVPVDDASWVRLKATHEQKLVLDIALPQRVSANAVAVVSNLDNAHYLKDGFVTTVLTVHTTAGDRTFEIKAGVHSSEWNRGETGGAEHAFPKDKHIGDKRWLAVFELPAGSVVTGLRFDHRDTDKNLYHAGAAPGFCLRGITLVTGATIATQATQPTPTPAEKATTLYDNGNIGGVGNGPQRATSFTLATPHVITLVQTYHWNSGRGATPGTIALRDHSGRTWGPWQARGTPGQGGVPNANWLVNPNVTLPAGTYTVIDSDPASWAQNAQSQGAGFVRVEGQPAQAGQTPAAAMPLQGAWRINANNHVGSLEFARSASGWTGRENIDGAWEPVSAIVYDAASGRIEFTRPRVAQRYRGVLSASGMSGTFDQSGAGQYKWQATR